MTSIQLQRMAQAASVIRRVVGQDFQCYEPGTWSPWRVVDAAMEERAKRTALLILQHDSGDSLRPYVNYDCCQYEKIEQLSDALSEIGLMVEDKTGWWSAVYEERA